MGLTLQTAVRDWRRDILSDGMYMNPDHIIQALESGENLDTVANEIVLETRREVQDFHTFETTGTLPVAEFLDYAIKEYAPVTEVNIDGVVKKVRRTATIMKKTVQNSATGATMRRTGMGLKNMIRTGGGNIHISGKFDKAKDSLTKIVKSCKTVGDVDYLISDRKNALVFFNRFAKDIKSGNVEVKYDPKKLDDYIQWIKGDYYKMLLERKEELSRAGKMESADPDTSADDSEFIMVEDTSIAKLSEALLSTASECGFNPDQRNLNEITPMDGSRSFSVVPWSVAERTVGSAMCDICEAETDEELTEAMLHFAMVAEAVNATYELISLEDASEWDVGGEVEESIGSAARGAVRDIRKGTRKIARKVDRTTKGIKVGVKKAVDPIVSLIDKNMTKIKDADASERREIILKGGMVPKVMRWIKRSVALAVGAAAGVYIPTAALLTAVAFIGWICTDKYLDSKQRHDILRQLEDEIEIVNEKIDDARGDTNKQKKYELMRIRNKLKRTSDKIRLNLKVNPEDDIVQNVKHKKANVK